MNGNPNRQNALTNLLRTIQQEIPLLFAPGATMSEYSWDVEMSTIHSCRHLLFILPKASVFLKIYPQIGFVSTI